MNKFLNILAALLLFLWGSTPAVYAQKSASPLPRYFEISNAREWTSPLLEFDEPVEGFRLTVFKTNTANHNYNGYPFVTLAELDVFDADGNEIAYSATTNSLARNDGNGLAGLCDNDLGNNGHYHSAYSGSVSLAPDDYVYIDVKFNEAQAAFKYKQVRRNNLCDFPLHFTLSPLGVEANPPFNPTNPGEPDAGGDGDEEPEEVYYSVTVAATPAGVANVSGGGTVLQGNSVYVNTSAKNSKYVFKHWTLNGEVYSTNRYVSGIVPTADMHLVAHYEFVPGSPSEPDHMEFPDVVFSPLYLVTNNDAACSFNRTSGELVEADMWVELEAYVSSGYEFGGWYNGGVCVSSEQRFNYLMPYEGVTLTAKVSKKVFNPANPSEPDNDGSQDDVQTTATGDINKDGAVDVLDIVAVVNYSLKASDENLSTYDVTGDGVVDILDIVRVVNLSLE